MSFLDFLRPFMAPPLTAATGGSKEEIMRSIMMTAGAAALMGAGGFGAGGTGARGGNLAQQLFGGQGGSMAEQMFPDIVKQIMRFQMQQSRQGIDTNQQAAMQYAQMPGYYPGQQSRRYPWRYR